MLYFRKIFKNLRKESRLKRSFVRKRSITHKPDQQQNIEEGCKITISPNSADPCNANCQIIIEGAKDGQAANVCICNEHPVKKSPACSKTEKLNINEMNKFYEIYFQRIVEENRLVYNLLTACFKHIQYLL